MQKHHQLEMVKYSWELSRMNQELELAKSSKETHEDGRQNDAFHSESPCSAKKL